MMKIIVSGMFVIQVVTRFDREHLFSRVGLKCFGLTLSSPISLRCHFGTLGAPFVLMGISLLSSLSPSDGINRHEKGGRKKIHLIYATFSFQKKGSDLVFCASFTVSNLLLPPSKAKKRLWDGVGNLSKGQTAEKAFDAATAATWPWLFD